MAYPHGTNAVILGFVSLGIEEGFEVNIAFVSLIFALTPCCVSVQSDTEYTFSLYVCVVDGIEPHPQVESIVGLRDQGML